MALETNVGGFDRLARGALGGLLVALAAGAFLVGQQTTALVAALVGAVLLFTATTQFCGVYSLLGIDTCSRE